MVIYGDLMDSNGDLWWFIVIYGDLMDSHGDFNGDLMDVNGM